MNKWQSSRLIKRLWFKLAKTVVLFACDWSISTIFRKYQYIIMVALFSNRLSMLTVHCGSIYLESGWMLGFNICALHVQFQYIIKSWFISLRGGCTDTGSVRTSFILFFYFIAFTRFLNTLRKLFTTVSKLNQLVGNVRHDPYHVKHIEPYFVFIATKWNNTYRAVQYGPCIRLGRDCI